MSNAPMSEDTTWWAEDRPIPVEPEQFAQPIVVRQQDRALPAQRSEYADLAELALGRGARDTKKVLEEGRRVGALLGARAYYDFPAGGGRVTGPSIDLMDALAIVWGRLVSTVSVLEETATRVHLRGRVVDLLALTAVERDYVSAISPAPGKFASKPDQADRWKVMQLQSASSKAIRGALEHALPAWLVDAALDAAHATAAAQATGGKPLPEARAAAVVGLGERGLDRATLEAWVGQPVDLWTVDELARLRTLYQQVARGEVAVEAIRAQVSTQPQPQAAPAGDRLAGLGLQAKPAPTNPSPAPSATPSTSGPAPSGAGQEPAPKDPAREAAQERLRKLLATNEPAVRHAARARQISQPTRAATETIVAICDDVEAALAQPRETVEQAIERLEGTLPVEACVAAANGAGLPVVDGVPVTEGAPAEAVARYAERLAAAASAAAMVG